MSHSIIFDLEATCWEHQNSLMVQEIIEIGAYKVDSFGIVFDEFDELVRPTIHPSLSTFCMGLTGIDQVEVNRAETFEQVFPKFYNWLDLEDSDGYLYSWGKKDEKLILDQLKREHLDVDYEINFFDLKSAYNRMKGHAPSYGFMKSLRVEGFEFEGEIHNALDDSYNLVKLFLKYREHWMNYA